MTAYLKMAVLPTLLASSLMLSACGNNSIEPNPNDEVNAANDATVLADNKAIEANEQTSSTTEDTMISNEQKMSDRLSRYRWHLDTAVDRDSQPLAELTTIKDQVVLNFIQQQGQNTVNYSVGCNMISAVYETQKETITIKDRMGTKMSCEDLNDAENSLNELMKGNSQLSLVEGETPMLTQVTSDMTTLVWKGVLTAQAKYSGKGETIFWAINATSKPCTDNNAQMCLQVKPITYDEQGIKTSEGALMEFAGTIDGYQHDGKHDTVLRLQRYQTATDTVIVDNKDSNYAYVLDTVIESAMVK